MGNRNQVLHAAALKAATKIGPLLIVSGHQKKKSFEFAERLNHEFVLKKMGLA